MHMAPALVLAAIDGPSSNKMASYWRWGVPGHEPEMKKLTLPILDAVPKDVGVIRLEQVVELQVVEDGVRETRIVPIKSFQVIIVWSANRIPLDVRDGYEMLETKTDAKGTIIAAVLYKEPTWRAKAA